MKLFSERRQIVEPKPHVKLVGTDGNAFAILGKCKEALRKAKASPAYINKFMEEAMSGDYDNLLRVAMEYCEVA